MKEKVTLLSTGLIVFICTYDMYIFLMELIKQCSVHHNVNVNFLSLFTYPDNMTPIYLNLVNHYLYSIFTNFNKYLLHLLGETCSFYTLSV